jgi:tetraacyldisaccharide 4'-kinase
VVVDPRRTRAAQWLLQRYACDVLLSDDGLQHLALARDIEVLVIDGMRQFGNGFCLPAGPLREPLSRLSEADILVSNGAAMPGAIEMHYRPGPLCAVGGETATGVAPVPGESIHAVAGIGNPERFFADLQRLGWSAIAHPYPDHYAYAQGELEFGDALAVVMTEKDAVKYAPYAGPGHWYLPVEAQLPEIFGQRLLDLLTRRTP